MKFLNIHGHKVASLKDELVIQNVFPGGNTKLETGLFYSIGLHPWYIEQETINARLDEIRETVQKPEVIAVGETGLDKIAKTSFDLQIEVFDRHIQISEELEKPLIIHCVRAFNELIQLKKKYKPKLPWILHGFNSKPEVAEMLIHQNIFLSFGKALIYPLSNAAQVLAKIQDHQFFLETDDSDYTIKEIYHAAAEIKKIDIDKMKSIILQNGKNSFGIDG